MEPVVVTAELENGFCASDPWSPGLDGLLAYWTLYDRLGADAFALGQSGHTDAVVLDADELPLAVERHGDAWWWHCSAPIYQAAAVHQRYFHRRFDQALAMARADVGKSGKVAVSSGPYKNYRIAVNVTICPTVTWHAIGDADAIARLVRRCPTIGRGGSQGLGFVREWRVEPDGNATLARFGRPLPFDFAQEHGVVGALMEWGIRPPGRLRQHRTLCVMPPTPR